MNKIKMWLKNPWVVMVLAFVFVCLLIRYIRKFVLKVVNEQWSGETKQHAKEDAQNGAFNWRVLGMSFLLDGLSGTLSYLKGENNSVTNYLLSEYGVSKNV